MLMITYAAGYAWTVDSVDCRPKEGKKPTSLSFHHHFQWCARPSGRAHREKRGPQSHLFGTWPISR